MGDRTSMVRAPKLSTSVINWSPSIQTKRNPSKTSPEKKMNTSSKTGQTQQQVIYQENPRRQASNTQLVDWNPSKSPKDRRPLPKTPRRAPPKLRQSPPPQMIIHQSSPRRSDSVTQTIDWTPSASPGRFPRTETSKGGRQKSSILPRTMNTSSKTSQTQQQVIYQENPRRQASNTQLVDWNPSNSPKNHRYLPKTPRRAPPKLRQSPPSQMIIHQSSPRRSDSVTQTIEWTPSTSPGRFPRAETPKGGRQKSSLLPRTSQDKPQIIYQENSRRQATTVVEWKPSDQPKTRLSAQSKAPRRMASAPRRILSAEVEEDQKEDSKPDWKPWHVYNLGEPGSGLKPRGSVQDFYQLRDKCLKDGVLFEDPNFPADDASVFYNTKPEFEYVWKRPHDLTKNPAFFSNGASRFDIHQGYLGDCWMLAAIADLTLNKRRFFQVVPTDQSFSDNYAGIFHFRFWQNGRWIDVVIDDRLMVNEDNELVYLKSQTNEEFWSPLLEKAFAKLHGCYEAIDGGFTNEALQDFTGGITEWVELADADSKTFNRLLKMYESGSFLECSFDRDEREHFGLFGNHAYSVTAIKKAKLRHPRLSGEVCLLRLRNPWGESEWTGAWSDKSAEWKYISKEEREALELTKNDDGEFWMCWSDFLTHFSDVSVCHLCADSPEVECSGSHKKWKLSCFESSWVPGVSSGGCEPELPQYSANPRFCITLKEKDEGNKEGKCDVVVAILQKNRRYLMTQGKGEYLGIGFDIFEMKDLHGEPLDCKFFQNTTPVYRAENAYMRENTHRVELRPGTYCIVPHIDTPEEGGDFLLRVFTEKKHSMKSNDEEITVDNTYNQDSETNAEEQRKMEYYFETIAGIDREINWSELKDILDHMGKRAMNLHFSFSGFSRDFCRSLIAMVDTDMTGTLNYEEFKVLWCLIKKWKHAFEKHDIDKSGNLDVSELREALREAGFRINNDVLNAIVHKFATRDQKLDFIDFMTCVAKLKNIIESYGENSGNSNGSGNDKILPLEDWVSQMIYT